jgi:hypothetical protein
MDRPADDVKLVHVTVAPAPIRVNFALPSGVIGVWTKRLVAEHAP